MREDALELIKARVADHELASASVALAYGHGRTNLL